MKTTDRWDYLEICLSFSNRNLKRSSLFNQFIRATRDYSGCSAMAVRMLDRKGNIPYKFYAGFSRSFITKEASSCEKYHLCINQKVVLGSLNPCLQLFSPKGSFFTGTLAGTLSVYTELKDDAFLILCAERGYQSIALIPLHLGKRIIGLIQIADKNPDMISLSTVKTLETAGLEFATAIRRVRAEERLIETEDRYRSLIELGSEAGEAIIILKNTEDVEGLQVLFNDVWPFLTGYSKKELLGMSFFDLVVPQDREASRKRHRRKMAGEPVPGLYQMGIRKKGGSTVSVELTGACTTIKKERANVIYIRNITERLESEAKLIESERHYHSLFDNMLSGIAYCEMIFKDGQPYDFRYLKVNDALEKLTGLKNVEGRTINELVPTLKESKPEIFEIYGKVASTGKSQRFEAYIDQMKLWLDISVYSTEIGYFTAIFDNISVRKQIIRDLERSEDQMRKLSQRLLAVQEEERSRIARDIHDQLVQELALMKILAVSLASKAVDDGIAAKTQQLVSLADKLINTTHRISIGLRPEMLDKLGLPKAVQWYAEEFERDSGISCPVDCQEESEDISIPRDIAIAAYRVIQEATTNIMRHSKASQANIFLNATKEMLRIKIIDNGIGFNMSKMTDESSLGLIGMRERIRAVGGVIVIKSNGKTGTRISAHFPINRGN